VIYFISTKFPETADAVCWQVFLGNPLVNCVPFDAKIDRDLINGKPTVFHVTLRSVSRRIPPMIASYKKLKTRNAINPVAFTAINRVQFV
jgi:hypothetical protein